MYDLVSKRFWLFLVSGIVILAGIISMATPFGRLRLSTEFSSGTQIRIQFDQTVTQNDLRNELSSLGYTNNIVRTEKENTTGQENFIIRLNSLDKSSLVLNQAELNTLEDNLKAKFGGLTVLESSDVTPEVASETILYTGIAVLVAAVGMLIYIIWAFRVMPHPLRYGTCGVIALLHDVIVSVGVFSIVAAFTGWEVDMMLVTGVLTILGYSINNTIIVFDRIRENVKYGISSNFEIVVNDSVIATMGRCLNTSITTLIAIVTLMLFVGATIQSFVIVLLIGIIAGTYDSMCVAPMLLVVWEKKEWGRFIGRKSSA